MKRLSFTLLLAVSVLTLASCIRSEEWELLRHPVHVQGTLDPTFGTPIAYGQVTINDVMHMFNGSYTGLLDPENDVLTINFEAEGGDSILARSLFDKSVGRKGTFMAGDTTISYSVNISFTTLACSGTIWYSPFSFFSYPYSLLQRDLPSS